MNTFKQVYTEKKTYSQFDESHFILYLNEEVINDYLPDTEENDSELEPYIAYAYSGTERDGGTLIEAKEATYDAFVSGLIRKRYSADKVEAITLNKLSNNQERKAEFDTEFNVLEEYRNLCKVQVSLWF